MSRACSRGDARGRGRVADPRRGARRSARDAVRRRRARHDVPRSRALGDERDAARRRSSGAHQASNFAFALTHARRGGRPFRVPLAEAAASRAGGAAPGALPARGAAGSSTSRTTPTARATLAASARRGRARRARSRRCCACCATRTGARCCARWRRVVVALRPHERADRAGEPRVGRWTTCVGLRARAGVRADAEPDFDAALASRERDGRDRARHRLVPHRRRRDGAVAGVSARRVTFADVQRRPPRIPRFLSRGVRRARAHHGRVARGRAALSRSSSTTGRRSSRSSSTPRRAATRSSASSTTSSDKGGREVALRPEMTPTLARMVAARANALRKPVRWFSHAAALPLRAAAEGAAARALPAQRRHRRRGRRHRRRRAARRARSTSCARFGLTSQRRRGARVRSAPAAARSRRASACRRSSRRPSSA